MKPSFSLLILIISVVNLPAQPSIQWQKTFGGTSNDAIDGIIQTADGGYVILGNTLSNDYDI